MISHSMHYLTVYGPNQVPAIIDPTPLAKSVVEYEQIIESIQVFSRSLLRYSKDLFNEDA